MPMLTVMLNSGSYLPFGLADATTEHLVLSLVTMPPLATLIDCKKNVHGGQAKFTDLVFATLWTNEGLEFDVFN